MSILKIFEKKITKADGSTFNIKRAVVENAEDPSQVLVYRLKFSNVCRDKFDKDFVKGDFKYPVSVEITPDNYFFVLSKADKNGKQYDELMLLDYTNMKQAEWNLPPKKTFEDKFAEKYGNKNFR